jgi:hypothetical protein
MATPPNFIDLARQQRLAVNNRLSFNSVVNGGAPTSQNVAIPILPPVPDYQKDGWNLSYSVVVSSAAFNTDAPDTKTLISFDPNGQDRALYSGAPFTDLRYGQRTGFSGWTGNRWYFQAFGSLFYSLSTAGDVEFKTTPTKNGVINDPPLSLGVWVCSPTFDCVANPLSALYIQPVY